MLSKKSGTFGMVYYNDGNLWKCSLRSDNDLKVNELARLYNGDGHDKFGTKTKQALVNFQKNSGIIPATGYFGPKTKAKIGELSQVTEKDNSNSFAKQNSASAILALNTSSGSGAGTYKLTVKKASLNKSLVGIVYIWPEPVSGPKFNFDTGGDEYLIKKNSTFSAMARVPNKTILFVDFTGDCTKTAPNIDACDIKMTSNKTITAVYKSKPFYQGWSLNLHPKEVEIGIGIGSSW